MNLSRPSRSDWTVSTLLARYVRERDMTAGVLTPRGLLGHLDGYFGHLDVRELDRFHYAGYRQLHHGKRVPATIAKELARLNAAINYARMNWREYRDLPLPPAVEAPTTQPRQTVWNPEQVQRLIAIAGGAGPLEFFLMVAIAAHTGARFTAIHSLTWDRIDLDRRRIDFRDPSKPVTGKRSHPGFPIGPGLYSILTIAKRLARNERLFSWRPDQMRDKLSILVGESELPEGTFHTFRHSWATNALAKGMTIHGVAQALAITPAMVVKIYGKADAEQERHAVSLYA